MKVKIKKLSPDAKIPKYAKAGDAGMDLYAISHDEDDNGNHVYNTGIAIELPPNHVALVFPRSSISKTRHTLRNAVGVIDSGYRGPIILKFWGSHSGHGNYKAGDRVAQMMILPYPSVELEEVDELSDSERGSCGFGSTGTN